MRVYAALAVAAASLLFVAGCLAEDEVAVGPVTFPAGEEILVDLSMKPPVLQKSFCMSTISRAVREGSTFSASCTSPRPWSRGSAAILVCRPGAGQPSMRYRGDS